MKHKSIIVISTPVSAKAFTQVTVLMDEDELAEAKLERPDLIFQLAADLPAEVPGVPGVPVEAPAQEGVVLTEEQGITIKGMTLPHNFTELVNKVMEKK